MSSLRLANRGRVESVSEPECLFNEQILTVSWQVGEDDLPVLREILLTSGLNGQLAKTSTIRAQPSTSMSLMTVSNDKGTPA